MLVNPKQTTAIILLLYCAFTLLSWPFIPIKYISISLYQAISLILLISLIANLLLTRRITIYFNIFEKRSPRTVIILFLSFYLLYLINLGFASLSRFYDAYYVVNYLKDILRFIVAIGLLFLLPLNWFKKSFDIYSKIFLILSIAGIMLTLLLVSGLVDVIGTIKIPENPNTLDDGLRDFYGLGMGWRQTVQIPGGYSISRLQSFADEPGTYAFAAIPAVVWSFYMRNYFRALVIFLSILLSLSLGAVLFFLIIFLLLLVIGILVKTPGKKLVYLLGLLLYLYAGWGTFEVMLSDPFLSEYLTTKYSFVSGSGGSFVARYEGLEEAGGLITDNPFGFGSGSKVIRGIQVDVGWIDPFLDAGLIGGLSYLIGYTLILFTTLSVLCKKTDSCVQALAVSVLAIYFAALQRTPVDGAVWHWWIVIGYLRFYYYHCDTSECHKEVAQKLRTTVQKTLAMPIGVTTQ